MRQRGPSQPRAWRGPTSLEQLLGVVWRCCGSAACLLECLCLCLPYKCFCLPSRQNSARGAGAASSDADLCQVRDLYAGFWQAVLQAPSGSVRVIAIWFSQGHVSRLGMSHTAARSRPRPTFINWWSC
ncbi:hypothetical protein COO60DRAFT_1283880, partial [Scenedesmus sp. NREL 46B-D3]